MLHHANQLFREMASEQRVWMILRKAEAVFIFSAGQILHATDLMIPLPHTSWKGTFYRFVKRCFEWSRFQINSFSCALWVIIIKSSCSKVDIDTECWCPCIWWLYWFNHLGKTWSLINGYQGLYSSIWPRSASIECIINISGYWKILLVFDF